MVVSVCWIQVIIGCHLYECGEASIEETNTLGSIKANGIVECGQVIIAELGLLRLTSYVESVM